MISAIGIALVDHILVIDGFPAQEGSYYCESYTIEGGGMAGTALCAAARLGAKTRLFTRIGDDLSGSLIRESVEAYGVDTSGTVTLSGNQSTVSFVHIDKQTGEKQFYSERKKEIFEGPGLLNLSLLEGTEVLLVDGHGREESLDGVRWAHQRGVPVVADFKRLYGGVEDLFPYIDYCILPLSFTQELTGRNSEEAMLKSLTKLQSGLPVVTMGEKGGVYLDDGRVKKYKVFPIDCVDSTGAGDAFHGAFCYFLSQGFTIQRCLECASAVGALNCRAIGGRSALPSREELSRFLTIHGSEPLSG